MILIIKKRNINNWEFIRVYGLLHKIWRSPKKRGKSEFINNNANKIVAGKTGHDFRY